MLSINTNISSIIAQMSLNKSTNALNQAIERMSTGFKINHSKDNAANYAIVDQVSNHISSLDIAEENTSMGIDFLNNAEGYLDEINDRLTRLRDLATQASNSTYGEDSLKAINSECVALVEEIKRVYNQAEFNGIKIYGLEQFETISPQSTFALEQPETISTQTTFALDPSEPTTAVSEPEYSTTYATLATTLQELGIDDSSFSIYNYSNSLIESYDTIKNDTIADIFNVLSTYGINGSITDGVITLVSTNGNYINGDLVDKLGIEVNAGNFVEATTQSSDDVVTYTELVTATEVTTLGDLGALTSGTDKIIVNDKYGDKLGEISVNSNTSLGGIFDALGDYDIQGSVCDGVISLSSSKGNYVVSEGVIADLDITNTAGSDVTYGSNQTSATPVLYEKVSVSGGDVTTTQQAVTTTIWTTTTNNSTNTITVTETVQVETTTVTTKKTVTTYYSAQTDTLGVVITSAKEIQSSSSFESGNVYKIGNAADLAYLATKVNSGCDTEGAVFVLTNDIDLSGYSSWTAIGKNASNSFNGIFDGNGHVIKNLTIDTSADYQGLFGYVLNASLENFFIENASIESSSSLVAIATGVLKQSTMNNVWVEGTVTGLGRVGALCGIVTGTGAVLSNSGANATVTGASTLDNAGIGIICGYTNDSGKISNCYATGAVTGAKDSTGGVVGYVQSATVSECYSNATVQGIQRTGGIVGKFVSGSVSNSYFSGTVNEGTLNSETIGEGSSSSVYASAPSSTTMKNMFSTSNGWSIVGGEPVLDLQVGDVVPRTLAATASTTLDEYGVSSSYIYLTNGTKLSFNFTESSTFDDILTTLNNSGYNIDAELVDGVLLIEGSNVGINLTTGSDNLFKTISLEQDSSSSTYTVSTTKTILVDKLVETETVVTINTTTTTSTTKTNTVDVTITTPIVYTTTTFEATNSTTFSDLALGSRGYVTLMKNNTESILTIKTADTVSDLVQALNNYGITTSFSDNKLVLTPQNNGVYITGMSDNLLNVLNLSNSFYTTSVGVANSDSNEYIFSYDRVMNQDTNLTQIGVTNGELVVKQFGENTATVTVDSTQNVGDLVSQLRAVGFNVACSDGKLSLNAIGDAVIEDNTANSSNLINAFKLTNIVQDLEATYVNAPSEEVFLLNEIIKSFYEASSDITIQVGINNKENSQIAINTGFSIDEVDMFANIGKKLINNIDFLSELDKMIAKINAKQTELGASQNRLMSAMEEISIRRDNLVSSRSTLRDADIAEVSSQYIQQQILQQASATLLSTANQTPAIALQLI